MTDAVIEAAPVVDPHDTMKQHRRRGIFFLSLAVGAAGFALMLQMGLNANFVVQQMHLSGAQQGGLEALRETCGIIAFAILALLSGFAEPVVAAAMLAVFGAGLAGYAFVPNYAWILIMSVVWSQGLHIWMPLPNSMMLSLAERGREGHRLGQLSASGAVGAGIGLAAAYGLTWLGVSIRHLYILAGAVGVLAGVACLGIPRQIKTPGPRLIFRRRYGLYYLLCFLEGWRKQIFLCFAGFLLVQNYDIPLTTMIVLWAIAQTIGYFLSPQVGKLIDRLGERKMLVFYYCCMIPIFMGYTVMRDQYVLFGLYILDSSMFAFNAALTTYVNRIAPKAEHTATLSMGVAMNHIAAVIMPLLGGLLWMQLGYQYAFAIGGVALVFSIWASLRVPLRAAAACGEAIGFAHDSTHRKGRQERRDER